MSIKMDAIKKVGKYVGKSVAGKVINSAYKYGYPGSSTGANQKHQSEATSSTS